MPGKAVRKKPSHQRPRFHLSWLDASRMALVSRREGTPSGKAARCTASVRGRWLAAARGDGGLTGPTVLLGQ